MTFSWENVSPGLIGAFSELLSGLMNALQLSRDPLLHLSLLFLNVLLQGADSQRSNTLADISDNTWTCWKELFCFIYGLPFHYWNNTLLFFYSSLLIWSTLHLDTSSVLSFLFSRDQLKWSIVSAYAKTNLLLLSQERKEMLKSSWRNLMLKVLNQEAGKIYTCSECWAVWLECPTTFWIAISGPCPTAACVAHHSVHANLLTGW